MPYKQILEGISQERNLREDSLATYLESLKPLARQLFNSYQTQEVATKYDTSEVQDCYLLRYYPVYAGLLNQELERVCPVNLLCERSITASFFGCGPAPELASLLSFLLKSRVNVKALDASLFDIDSAQWAYARNIAINYILNESYKFCRLGTHSDSADFTSADFFNSNIEMATRVRRSKLVVFQNCLNEVRPQKILKTIFNIKIIIELVPPKCLIIFIDQAPGKYRNIDRILNEINSHAGNSQKINLLSTLSLQKYDCKPTYREMPNNIEGKPYYRAQTITEQNSGLVLRREIKYSSIVLEKT